MIACDISSYQPVVNDTYPHPWLIFRGTDPGYPASSPDSKAAPNLAWCKHAKASGRLAGYTVYVVYRPGLNRTILSQLDTLGVPTDATVMIDAESWSGEIAGDHSTDINTLAELLATRQGSRTRVWGYGNLGPDAAIWPTKPAWLGFVIASYGGTVPTVPNMVGWQYTNGQYVVPGLPNSSPPFGPCDHNQLTITAGGIFMALSDAQQIEMHDRIMGLPVNSILNTETAVGHARVAIAAVQSAVGAMPTAAEIVAAIKADPPAGVNLTDAQMIALAAQIAALAKPPAPAVPPSFTVTLTGDAKPTGA